MSTSLDLWDRTYLREFLVARFSLSELRDLCFDLGVNAETLPHTTLTELARELVAYAERREQLSCLLIQILRHREDHQLGQLLAELPACHSLRKVQLILPQDRLRNPQELLSQLATLLDISPNEINLIATASGSVRVLISLPSEAAARLLQNPPTQIAGNEVLSVLPFEFLPPGEQHRWQEVARRAGSVPPVPPVVAGWLTGWKLGLVALIVLLLIGLGVTAIAMPRLTFQNDCGRPITLGQEIPLIGSQIEPGSTTVPLWPGEYHVSYDGEAIALRTPSTDFGVIRPSVPLVIEMDGEEISPNGETVTYAVRPGTRVRVTLCPF